ncbi:proprotein convertase subtilisin/kexin type 5-like [Lingula anatina]|uniref:Proprotein convertase subtilisin/kexin type 5-like n=1 Tax=Lingula anatina TaxID=7574 RepID=A0A1S3HF75_LINAN|nr:proprotein convertase subtilisin/kexin type 5-like [Lingula anatina]|eukprot:XP_013384723.1 proprotein convertase subtilisin/kexin type 5-like [Lingula anatina]
MTSAPKYCKFYTQVNLIFDANSDRNTIVTVTLTPPIFAQYLRLNPVTWHNRIALRMEMVGCSQAEQKYYDVSCVRCLTSYYCEGDGVMHSCARCDNATDTNDTCGRSPTEHSFGLQAQCSPCPAGWICSQGYAAPCVDFTYVDYCNDTYCPDSCAQCELGYACRGGQRYQCEPGSYSDGNLKFCEMCAPGTFQNESGQDGCLPCDPGKYSSKSKDRCDWCPTGMYAVGKSIDSCDWCPTGMYAVGKSIDSCDWCPTGMYAVGKSIDSCDWCPTGMYAVGKSIDSCDWCPTGMYALKELIQHTESTLGPVDILVNNAGIWVIRCMKNLHVEEWDQQVDVNIKGVLNCIGAVISGMCERKSGHIVNMSSQNGKKGRASRVHRVEVLR